MTKLYVSLRDGSQRIVEGAIGQSLMEALRDNDVDDLLAMCGGCRSCATCHVQIAPQWIDKLSEMSVDEDDLLSISSYRNAGSRLSCQVVLAAELDGMELTIPPEE